MKEELNSNGIQLKHTQRFNKERQTRNKEKNKLSTQMNYLKNGTRIEEKI